MFRSSRSLCTLTVLASAVLLGACSTGTPILKRNPQVAASPDKVSAQLAEAADRASVALETLAAVEQARSPGIAVAPIENAPPELRRAITVNWVGPVDVVTRTLADRAGYAFNIIGNTPVTPVVVSIDVENKPVIDVLRNIGLQLGMRADIRVDATRRLVEIHYAPNTGVGG
ncbi:MAG: DotD/TraH family lipoprotein [Micavibrio aeruginosavorus]|uniref:DotD/TraH family lipoprotein n=1 Tax=Micavibrio aeruginosavorus TaxID=349221 RepID=A0A7T5R2R1_9BACT|nr:MAG: DotD/TraH family lipoprotein [Micavibrio aeruginosavorus]